MRRSGFLLLLLAACGGSPAPSAPPPAATSAAPAAPAPASAAPADGVKLTTQSGTYDVVVRFDPPTPPLDALFAVVATVTERRSGRALESGKVLLNARMPQHDHGMQTQPVDDPGRCDLDASCPHPGGVFRTEGFKFHMSGAWTVTVDVLGPDGPDSTSFVVEQP